MWEMEGMCVLYDRRMVVVRKKGVRDSFTRARRLPRAMQSLRLPSSVNRFDYLTVQ